MEKETKMTRSGARNIIPSLEVQKAILKNLIEKALSGDVQASEAVLRLAAQTGKSILKKQTVH